MQVNRIAFVAVSTALVGLSACEKKEMPDKAASQTTPQPATPAHADHHGGAVVDLGTQTVGPFTVKATRDDGQIVAGKEAPVDVTVTAADGSIKATAVRFWIGTQDAKGSVKAKAEIENPAEPNRWHTHAEIPAPLPEGSKLWVEVEDDKGATSIGSFDLKV